MLINYGQRRVTFSDERVSEGHPHRSGADKKIICFYVLMHDELMTIIMVMGKEKARPFRHAPYSDMRPKVAEAVRLQVRIEGPVSEMSDHNSL